MIDIDKLQVGDRIVGKVSGLLKEVLSINRPNTLYSYRVIGGEHDSCTGMELLEADAFDYPVPQPASQVEAQTPAKRGRGRSTKAQVQPPAIDIHASYAAFRTCIDAVFKEHAPKAKYCSDIAHNSFLLEFDVGNGAVIRRYPADCNLDVTRVRLCEDLQDEALRLGNKQLRG